MIDSMPNLETTLLSQDIIFDREYGTPATGFINGGKFLAIEGVEEDSILLKMEVNDIRLKGFYIEKLTLRFHLYRNDKAIWDMNNHVSILESGKFQIFGRDYPYDPDNLMEYDDWFAVPQMRNITIDYFNKLFKNFQNCKGRIFDEISSYFQKEIREMTINSLI